MIPLALPLLPALAALSALSEPAVLTDGENDDLERRVLILEQQLDAVTSDLERAQHGSELVPPIEGSEHGMGPAASKIYQTENNFSIGGYGEFLFSSPAGGTDTFDAQRVILYFGQRFNEKWLLNTEIEFEHASTSQEGSVSVEFAYIDYLATAGLGLRGGLLLIPMGFINELHEPVTFLPANRPQTERRIIPTTWRENGIGVFGESSGFSYRAYVVNGLEGEDFSSSGLRGGRQKGSEALAEDMAVTGRLDYVDVPGFTIGASLYHGDSSQDVDGIGDLTTTIFDVHAEYQAAGWKLRGLFADASIDDVDDFNDATGAGLSDELDGWYVEAGYDLFADVVPVSGQSLSPFVRFESIDTGGGNDEITTIGLAYQPIDQVILKLDYEDWAEGDGTDSMNFLIGYVF